MVGISSTLRLVTLAIVAISMSHAAIVEGEADIAAAVAEKAESPDATVSKGGDAVPYVSEASTSPVVDKEESPSMVQGGDSVGYGCGASVWPHSCWKYCSGGGWCWTLPKVNCFQDSDCAGDPPCNSSC